MSRDQRGLVFYEKAHRYRLDGEWVPGVTTLINGGLPKDALKYWAARTVAEFVAGNPDLTEDMKRMGGYGPTVAFLKEIPFQRRDDAAVRGTDVHDLAERLVHGGEVDVPAHLAGYVSACVDFLDDWGIEPLVVERPLAHRAHWWAGKPDLFARTRDGDVILYDYKTTASGIWPETAFQLAAYSHAEFYVDDDGAEQPIPEVSLCAAVHLREDGYSVVPLKADDSVYQDFRHIAYVANAAKRAKGDRSTPGYVGEPLAAPAAKELAS